MAHILLNAGLYILKIIFDFINSLSSKMRKQSITPASVAKFFSLGIVKMKPAIKVVFALFSGVFLRFEVRQQTFLSIDICLQGETTSGCKENSENCPWIL